MTTATCTRCKKCKPMDAFGIDSRRPAGRTSRCLDCRTEVWRSSEAYAKRVAAFKRIPNPWTATEDHLVRQLFPKGGSAACAPVLPNRTRAAIAQRAAKLEVAGPVRAVAQIYGVPVHDYSAEDYAMRAWRYPVARGQLIPALMRMQG